ncbi:MAG: hypothetical protein PWQ88_310 [Candidatus Methanomethylophilaceae archaeon]|nr:hypothetical protein [Candidatus Methanomethylophilaceae archaeon]MDI3542006.1 hypothetical protein [Candidatus Methanomethylophilaceae archaeon]
MNSLDIDLNIDTANVPLPTLDELKTTYLKQIIGALVLTIIFWLVVPGDFGSAEWAMSFFPQPLTLLMSAMLISYVMLAVCSSDEFISKLQENNYLKSLNRNMIYAMLLSLGGLFLSWILIHWFDGYTGWADLGISHHIAFLFGMFVAFLALMFFITVLMTFIDVAKLRTLSEEAAPAQNENE